MLYKSVLKEIPPIPMDKVKVGKYLYMGVSQIVDTKKCGKVLVVDVHRRKMPKETLYRFFSDGNSFQIYDVQKDEWKQSKMQSVLSGRSYTGWYGFVSTEYRIAASAETISMLKKHIKCENRQFEEITAILDNYISGIFEERNVRARDNKMLRVEQRMNMYPDLPEDLGDYLKNEVFEKYLFMSKLEKGIKPAICSSCGKKIKLPKGTKHRTITTCPKCGQKAVAFESRYIDSIKEKASVCIANRVDNQLLLRWLNAYGSWYLSEKSGKYMFSFTKTEYFRTMYLFEKGQERILHFDFKYVYPFGIYWREQRNWNRDDLSYVYSRNLEEIFGKKYYNVDLQQELSENTQPLHFVKILDNLKNLPPTEYLVKMGMYRLASELDPDEMKPGKDFGEILGVNPQYKKLYCEHNISLIEHNIIQASNQWVNEEDFLKMRRLRPNSHQAAVICNMLQNMSFKRFVNYFSKQRKIYPRNNFEQLLTWYNDYIGMSKSMGVDLSNKSVRFPKDIKAAHDRVVAEFKIVEDEILNEQMRQATERLYNGLTEYQNGDYAIVFPKTRNDFIVEGQSLSHCVGTQEKYFKNHIEGTYMIFFVRKAEEIEKPFVTMEIDMRRLVIQQIYGYGDKRPAQPVINFANKFLRLLKNENVAVGRVS